MYQQATTLFSYHGHASMPRLIRQMLCLAPKWLWGIGVVYWNVCNEQGFRLVMARNPSNPSKWATCVRFPGWNVNLPLCTCFTRLQRSGLFAKLVQQVPGKISQTRWQNKRSYEDNITTRIGTPPPPPTFY